MRIFARKFGLLACFAGLSMLAAEAAGQPPKAAESGKDDLAEERAKLQKQLADLLKRVEATPHAPVPTHPKSVSPKKSDAMDKSVDPVRQGMNLFRENDFDAALRAFRYVDADALTREDRAFTKYMEACCLRRLNKSGEAIALYREVADAKEDEFVAEMAIWQLSMIRSSQELESQIGQLRVRPKTR